MAGHLVGLKLALRRNGLRRSHWPQQVALAWQLAKAPVVIPIPGSSRPETILDSAAAAGLRLSADELARLDRV